MDLTICVALTFLNRFAIYLLLNKQFKEKCVLHFKTSLNKSDWKK